MSEEQQQCEHGVIKGFCMTCFECENEALRQHLASMSKDVSAKPCPSCSRLEAENVRLREELAEAKGDFESFAEHHRAVDEAYLSATSKLSALIASVREVVNNMRRNVVNSAAIGSGETRPKSIASGRDVQRWADALQQAIGDTQ